MAIKLSKSGDSHTINLSKASDSLPTVHVNLDWEELKSAKSSGFFGKLLQGSSDDADLDLGCMYEMQNGEKGVIQPLGGNFGSKTASPYIFLDRDDRTGATDGENMYIFRPDLIKRVMIFGLIYNGAADFKSVQGRVFFTTSKGEEIYLELDNPDANRTFCATALVQNTGSNLEIIKETRYFAGHEEADKYYGFGFRWQAGSK